MDENIEEETTVEERLQQFLHGKCAYRHHLEDGLMDVINVELKKAYDEGVKDGLSGEDITNVPCKSSK